MRNVIVVHYHEIALKGRNRPWFVSRLAHNLQLATNGMGVERVRDAHDRIVLELGAEADLENLKKAVGSVFGVSNYAAGFCVLPEMASVREVVARELPRYTFGTFRIDARRADKRFALTSEEINRELGAFVQGITGAPVRLKGADLIIYVEVLPREAFVSFERLPGPGGLPVSVSGSVVCLLSGGIDSPVAAYRMMKRGCRCVFVHFHSYPFLDSSSKQKAEELVELLTRFQYESRLYLVPFGEVQRRIVVDAPEPLRVVLYRRLMARIAAVIAEREGAMALVTGESLGQVASQTLENLSVIEQAVGLPVLRPLIGMDKLEIVCEAEKIGTYAISCQPDQDCCQLFTPRRPATRATLAEVLKAEVALDTESLVRQALEDPDLEIRDYAYRGPSLRRVDRILLSS